MYMNLTRMTASLALFFIFIFPISAESFSGEETAPAAESLSDEESPIVVEPASNEETAITAESIPDDEYLLDDDSFFFEAPALVFEANPIFELRSFNEIFPDFSRSQKISVMSNTGLRYSFEKDGSPLLIPSPNSGIDLLSSVMVKKPSHVVEALVVVPYNKRELDMLDVYNALGKIKDIKEHTISVNGREINIFKETTRLDSAKNRKPISDPSPADTLPYSETMYLRFLDPYLGDLYLRGEVSISLYGLTYSMTNFRDVTYSIFRVMKAERFSAIIYLEPVKEGILIYSMSGLYLPNFIAKRINLTPNMNRRITVLLNWITDGLRSQEDSRQADSVYRMLKK